MKKLYFLLFVFSLTTLSYGQTSDLYFSMVAEGSSNNKFIEIYNGTGAAVNLDNYAFPNVSNEPSVPGEYEFWNTFPSGTMLADGDVFVIAHGSADQAILDEADMTFNFLSNGDDGFALVANDGTWNDADMDGNIDAGEMTGFTILDWIGDWNGDPGSGWEVAGVANGTQNHTLTRKTSVCGPNNDWAASAGTDAASSEWIVGDIDTGWDQLGSYTGCVSDPSLTITSPSDGQVIASGTTSVDIAIDVQNFVVGNPGTGDGHIHWTLNSVMQPMKYNTDPESIMVTDGESYTVYMELVDDSHQPIVPAVNQTITFSVAYPCDLQIGTIVETCDNITPATTDTYNVTLDFTGGGTTTYTIDTGGVGTVGGDDPTSMAMGTITISNITEGTDFTVTFTGDPMNSGCNFTRNINSPDCDPELTLPLYEGFDYTVSSNLIDAPNWSNISSSTDEILINGPGGLTYPNLASSSQTGNHATFDGGGSDSAIEFAAVTTGTVYTSFLINVTDISSVTTPGYFALLGSFDARLWAVPVVPPSAQGGGGQYQIGISNVNTAPTGAALDPTVLSTGSTVLIVMSYDTDTGVMNAWVNPSDATFGSASAPSAGATDTDASPQTNMNQFALRQDSTSETPFILFDELRIGTSWADVTPVTLSNNEFNLDSLTIYPNPTNTGFVNIKSPNTDAMSVQVFDILGKQVKNETLTDNTLNVSNLNTGVYILKITQNNATTTKKLVIK